MEKGGQRLPLWFWVAMPAAVVVVAVVALSLAGDVDPVDPGDANATVEEVATRPGNFYGETVTLSGEVEDGLGPDTFAVGADAFGGELLVVNATGGGGEAAPSEGEAVRITGTVRRFYAGEIEEEAGVNLDEDRLAGWRNTPAIVARSVAGT